VNGFIEDAVFPECISSGSVGGPGFKTNVRVYGSGYESRRVRWNYPRYSYNVAYGVKTAQDMNDLIAFFNTMDGKGYGFRYGDPLDYSTAPVFGAVPTGDDVVIINGAVGGEQSDIQLVKLYTEGSRTVTRPIKKPIDNGRVIVHVDGTPAGFTLDYATGLLTLDVALTIGQVLSWGGDFHVPCRFDTDTLQITLNNALVGNTSINVVEVFV